MKTIRRFDVVLVDFGKKITIGEQAGIRPAIVIQNDIGNLHSPTTIVMPLTSRINKNNNQPTHILIEKDNYNGLSCDSVMLAEGIRQVSKGRIKGVLGKITEDKIKNNILKALYVNFGLEV